MEMNGFEVWNLRLLERFFRPGRGPCEVFIEATPDVLDEIGHDIGGDAGFLAAVRAGPDWKWKSKSPSIETKMHELVERRVSSKCRLLGYTDPSRYNSAFSHEGYIERSAPVYLPYLAALARGAAIADENGFYAGLQRDLHLPHTWSSNQMCKTEPAWRDLERWTISASGRFGRFAFRRLGGLQFVGLAKSQVMISTRDIPALQTILLRVCGVGDVILSSSVMDRVLEEIRSERASTSKALKQAASNPDYRTALDAAIATIYADWKLELASDSNVMGFAAKSLHRKAQGARIGLALGEGDAMPWSVLLEIDEGAIDNDGSHWSEDVDQVESDASPPIINLARRGSSWIAELSHDDSSKFLLNDQWTIAVKGTHFTVEHRDEPIVLVDGDTDRYELWGSGLPEFGPATVVFQTAESGVHVWFADTFPDAIRYKAEDKLGLPLSWEMYRIDSCETLSKDARNKLAPVRTTERLMVLQGGSKQDGRYFAFDLPTLFYRGPAEWRVAVAGEKRLELVPDAPGPAGDVAALGRVGRRATTKTYSLPRELEKGGEFKLICIDTNGQERASCLVSVQAVSTGIVQGDVPKMCLDRLGRLVSGVGGLRGGLHLEQVVKIGSGTLREPAGFRVPESDLGRQVRGQGELYSAAEILMDMLAREGGCSYGRARCILDRHLAKQSATLTATEVLLDLWRRGHLEIGFGRDRGIERLYSVPPAVYPTSLSVDGRAVLGLIGTLSISQLNGIRSEELAWTTVIDEFARDAIGALHVMRLIARLPDSAVNSCLARIGLAALPYQGDAMAKWSANEREARASILATSTRSIDLSELPQLSRFEAHSASYVNVGSYPQMGPDKNSSFCLYRFKHQYRLRFRRSLLSTNVGAHLDVDESWSRWMVMTTTARGLRNAPIAHSEKGGTLYLPLELRPPIVLERALILCSGSPPLQVRLQSREDGAVIEFCPLGTDMSLFEMKEGSIDRAGTTSWLKYVAVPSQVIREIRSKGL